MQNVLAEVEKLKCPKCLTKGSLELRTYQFIFVCRHCQEQYLDPFEEGPWDNATIISDTYKGKQVRSYRAELPPQEEGVDEPDENMLDFLKFIHEREHGDEKTKKIVRGKKGTKIATVEREAPSNAPAITTMDIAIGNQEGE